jgi:hypothetical protein
MQPSGGWVVRSALTSLLVVVILLLLPGGGNALCPALCTCQQAFTVVTCIQAGLEVRRKLFQFFCRKFENSTAVKKKIRLENSNSWRCEPKRKLFTIFSDVS